MLLKVEITAELLLTINPEEIIAVMEPGRPTIMKKIDPVTREEVPLINGTEGVFIIYVTKDLNFACIEDSKRGGANYAKVYEIFKGCN